MKKAIMTAACLAMAFLGFNVITSNTSTIDVSMPHGTLSAATISTPKGTDNGQMFQIPTDILLDQAKKLTTVTDTVVIYDTVQVTNTKYIKVPDPKCTTDTLYMPLFIPNEVEGASVKNRSPGQTKKSVVVLSVDGQVVYKTDEP